MAKQSAGILLYRIINDQIEFMLVHPGGPFWSKKDIGAWSIPKGEFTEDEDPLKAALREFREETGKEIDGDFIKLNAVKMKSGKWIYAYALEKDFDCENIVSNTFNIEWPPKSGKLIEIPEVDKATWFDFETSRLKINPAQQAILEDLLNKLKEKKLFS